ncbi:MAG TPA: polysaccharide deacetylase family protein [Candidatus Acidoferrales bacterium]|nr:polysaccharide deacetylase family protein [Candidatus Acidoferrales bacterium]
MQLALKVDVCTFAGMQHGVPALMQAFDELGIRASFFVTCGPDHSGRAIRRVFRRGFFEKMRRTNAVGTYGWKTLLYGTVLPGPLVAQRNAQLLRELVSRGHEVAMHGYNHVYWHDQLSRLSPDAVNAELGRAQQAFTEAVGSKPQSFGAPGWQCTAASFAGEDALGLKYHSDTRGHAPYRPQMDGRRFSTIEIPTTMATLDETYGRVGTTDHDLLRFYNGQLKPGLNVYTAHAEMDGRGQLSWLKAWLKSVQQQAPIVRLIDVVEQLDEVPYARVIPGPIEGRAGAVAWQESPRG